MVKEERLISQFLSLNRQRRLRIYCFGDAMVDQYYYVEVRRVSPEFPMPIMWSPSIQPVSRPGGAANVIYQLQNFNVAAFLGCFFDADAALMFWENYQIETFPGTFVHRAHLPVKQRFVHNGLQLVRHDIEGSFSDLTPNQIDDYHDGFALSLTQLQPPDVVILSDYDKGFFSQNSYLDLFKNVKTIVDPKNAPIIKWKGCTIFKPNAKEATELSGRSDWHDQAAYFQEELGCEAVVITHGGEKVVGTWDGRFFEYAPTQKVKVQSVVGAGDCFCALFAMAIGYGFTIPEAVEIAWNAGAVYVGGKMNRPIIPAELVASGIVEPEDLAKRDFRLVFTNGVYDFGLTASHVYLLHEAKKHGDKLVVAINSDESVRRLKGENRPVMNLEERMRVVAAVKDVDFVTYFGEDTPLEIIKKIMPDIIVKGGDYRKEDVIGFGVAPVEVVPFLEGTLSTTKKLEKFGRI